jgi:hypothetical protein
MTTRIWFFQKTKLKLLLGSARFGKMVERVWYVSVLCLGVYSTAVYFFPLLGLIPYVLIPLKATLEMVLCLASTSAGILTGLQRASMGDPSIDLNDSFLIVNGGSRFLGTCCLEVDSVSGSTYLSDDGKPRYRDGMLLAMQSGLHKSATVAFEAGVDHGIPFLRIFVTASSNTLDELKSILSTEATRVEAILLASLSTVELRMLAKENLRSAASRTTSILYEDESPDSRQGNSISLVTLKGVPRVLPSQEASQTGRFISTLLKQGYSASMTCVFSAASPGREKRKLESSWRAIQARERRKEESLKDHAKKRYLISEYEEIGTETGWFDSSVYFSIRAEDDSELKMAEQGVRAVVYSIWGGKNPLKLRKKQMGRKTSYRLLVRRHMTKQKLHSSQLASFVSTPIQRLPNIGKTVQPSFQIPSREIAENEIRIGRAVFEGRLLFEVGLRTDWLREHAAVLGATGTGKTTLVKHIVARISENSDIPWWIFDIKGSEYSDMAMLGDVLVIRPGDPDDGFIVDFVDPQAGSEENIVSSTFVMLKELLKERGESSDLSPAMERLLRESITKMVSEKASGCSSQDLIDTIMKTPGKGRVGNLTRDALLNRLEILTREPLGSILGGGKEVTNLADLLEKRVVFDLHNVARMGGMDAARLLYNLVAKRIFDYAMKRGIVPGLQHLVVLEEASNLVPESYTRHTAADVTTGESMVMLQRATGQGVIVVATRPNISSNILANTAIKIIFRLPYDSKVGERFLSLDENQGRYLTTLKRGRALMSIPQAETFEIATTPFELTRRALDKQSAEMQSDTVLKTDRTMDAEKGPPQSTETGTVIFDRLGQFGNHLVAHLASVEMLTEVEVKEFIGSLDSSSYEDIEEILRDLVAFGTVERESFSLVPGGVIYTLPGNAPKAIRNIIVHRILASVDEDEVTVSDPGLDLPDLVLSEKAVLIEPNHLKSSSMKRVVSGIKRCMKNLGTGISELFVVVRGSVAAARLRDTLSGSSEFDDVTVVSAFPSSLESMIESFSKGQSVPDLKPQQLNTEKLGPLGAIHEVGTATSRAVQIRLWFELIQEFVALSGGRIGWDSILEFIDTTALQSAKGRTAPLMKDEGKRALTELLADEVLTAIRIGGDVNISGFDEGLWIANSSVLKDLKASVIESFEQEFTKRGLRLERDHGYYDFCVGNTSYVIFPTQQQLSTLMNLHNDVACRKCESVRVVCILTATEYLEDNAVTPSNLTVLTMEDTAAALIV